MKTNKVIILQTDEGEIKINAGIVADNYARFMVDEQKYTKEVDFTYEQEYNYILGQMRELVLWFAGMNLNLPEYKEQADATRSLGITNVFSANISVRDD